MSGKNEKVVLFSVITFLFLLLFSFLPELKLPYIDYKVKRLDLFSDIRQQSVDSLVLQSRDDSFQVVDSIPTPVPSVEIGEDTITKAVEVLSIPRKKVLEKRGNCVAFEDYGKDNSNILEMVKRLLELKSGSRKSFRMGFLGDSFIEGDMLTENVRIKLQETFGGRGVGFVPISHISSTFRTSIKHSYKGWATYSMIKPKEADCSKLTMTGYYFIPEEGASVSYKASKRNAKEDEFSKIQLLFINQGKAKITAVVNKAEVHEYYPDSSSELQEITIEGNSDAVNFKFESVEGLIVYGVYLNDEEGIYVDNFSMRGSSGLVLSLSDAQLSESWRGYKDYDVLVLQYGLNVISKDILNYNSYKRNMVVVLNKLKKLFPNTIFVVMSIGDRGFLKDGKICTMPEALAMIEAQRGIAKEGEVLFWNTFEAMGGLNSIQKFVNSSPPLANKDFVHINKAGGEYIANEFINSINLELKEE
ncbi:MAG: hypothetical protein ACRCY5_06740 [Phocaeicola sp.]